MKATLRNMTARLFSCVLLVLVAACGSERVERPETPSSKKVEDAEQAVRDFAAALEEMDPSALDSTVTRDFELVEDTLILDVEEFKGFIERYADSGAKITDRELSDFNTEVQGSVAWIRYRHRGVLTKAGEQRQLEWLESAVLRKEEGGWRIDRLQSNPIHSER